MVERNIARWILSCKNHKGTVFLLLINRLDNLHYGVSLGNVFHLRLEMKAIVPNWFKRTLILLVFFLCLRTFYDWHVVDRGEVDVIVAHPKETTPIVVGVVHMHILWGFQLLLAYKSETIPLYLGRIDLLASYLKIHRAVGQVGNVAIYFVLCMSDGN